jgi:hypothetical protein
MRSLSDYFYQLEQIFKAYVCYVIILAIFAFEAVGFLLDLPINFEIKFGILSTGLLLVLLGIFRQITSIESNLQNNYVSLDQSQQVRDYIEKQKVTKAKMIQYSGHTDLNLILKLLEEDTCKKIQLLLVNPFSITEKEEKNTQINRIQTTIEAFSDINERVKLKKLYIRMYGSKASIRGVNFDDKHIIIGWYHYYQENGKLKVDGKSSPVISLNTCSNGGREIRNFFNDVFDKLYEDSDDINELLKDSNFLSTMEQNRRQILKDYLNKA